jgi:hypothetical protein
MLAEQQPEDAKAGGIGGLHDHEVAQLLVSNGAGKDEEVCK